MASLFILAHSMMNMDHFLKDKHYLLYYVSLGMFPKYLFTLDENLENVEINVRVGQGIDTVGQVGKPRQITGF